MLTVRVGTHRYATPFAVREPPPRARARAAPADHLAGAQPGRGQRGRLSRRAARGRARERAPPVCAHGPAVRVRRGRVGVARFLDREHLRYDITTDLAPAGAARPLHGRAVRGPAALRPGRHRGRCCAPTCEAAAGSPGSAPAASRERADGRRRTRTAARQRPGGAVRRAPAAGAGGGAGRGPERPRRASSRGVPALVRPVRPARGIAAPAAAGAPAGVGRHGRGSPGRGRLSARTAESWRGSASTGSAARCAPRPPPNG